MKTIWKYELLTTDEQTMRIPKGAFVLCVQMQYDKPCLWALVDLDAERENRTFTTVGTGHQHDAKFWLGLQYIGTYQLYDGKIVAHVFEKTLPEL